MPRIVAIALGLLLLVCCGYAGLLVWFDGERIRSTVSERLSERYGLSLTVGSVERSISPRPLIRVESMNIANAKHSEEPLVKIESASFRLHPWTLVAGPVRLDDLVIEGITVSVPVDDEGALYWDPLVEAISSWLHRFDWSVPHFTVRGLHTDRRHVSRGNDLLISAGVIEGVMPAVEDLALVATEVSANLETTLPLRVKGTAQLDKLALQRQDGELPVVLLASGHIAGKPLTIKAAGGNLLDGDPMERDPLEATIEVGPSTSKISGTMSRDADTHVAFDVTYDEPARGGRPPLHIEAHVSDPGINWRIADLRATQGDSSLTGILEIRHEGDRRLFDASATVTNVEYPEIDEEEDGDSGDEKEKGDAKKEKGLRELLPEGDLYAHLLRGIEKFDADIELRAEQSRLLGVPFDWITIRTRLDQGSLSATVEDSRIRESALKGSFSITAAEDETAVDLSAELRDADLSALISGIERLEGVSGSFDGELSLRAAGRDTPAVLGSTGGRLTLFLEDGSMPDELAQRLAGDVLTALFADFDENDKTAIRCAIVDFEVDGGLASAQQMAMTTSEFLMFGDGRIDLQKGTLDLKFVPRPRDFSLLSMTLPFRIHGPLDDVRFNPDVSEGVASLLTPLEFGSSDEISCEPPKMAAREE